MRLAGHGHLAIDFKPLRFHVGHQLQHSPACGVRHAGLLAKGRIDFDKAIVDRYLAVVKNDFDNAEGFVNRVKQHLVLRGDMPQFFFGLAAAGPFPVQADKQQQQCQRAQRAAQQHGLQCAAAVLAALRRINFQVVGFFAPGLFHQRTKLVHAFPARKRRDRLAGGQQALGLAHRNGLFQDRHFFFKHRCERGNALLLAGVVHSQQAQAFQLGGEQAHGRVVGLQILCLTRDDKTALSGFCILETGHESINLRDDRAALRFALFRAGLSLHASIGQSADAHQAGQHQHQQAVDQLALDGNRRHVGSGVVMKLRRGDAGGEFGHGHGCARSTQARCGSAQEPDEEGGSPK